MNFKNWVEVCIQQLQKAMFSNANIDQIQGLLEEEWTRKTKHDRNSRALKCIWRGLLVWLGLKGLAESQQAFKHNQMLDAIYAYLPVWYWSCQDIDFDYDSSFNEQ